MNNKTTYSRDRLFNINTYSKNFEIRKKGIENRKTASNKKKLGEDILN